MPFVLGDAGPGHRDARRGRRKVVGTQRQAPGAPLLLGRTTACRVRIATWARAWPRILLIACAARQRTRAARECIAGRSVVHRTCRPSPTRTAEPEASRAQVSPATRRPRRPRAREPHPRRRRPPGRDSGGHARTRSTSPRRSRATRRSRSIRQGRLQPIRDHVGNERSPGQVAIGHRDRAGFPPPGRLFGTDQRTPKRSSWRMMLLWAAPASPGVT